MESVKEANPLKFYSLQVIKFHSDSVKNESARRKNYSLFRVKSNLVSVLKNVLFLIVISLRKFNELFRIKKSNFEISHVYTIKLHRYKD